MHKGYSLTLKEDYAGYYTSGLTGHKVTKAKVDTTLKSFKLPSGDLDGSKMQANWFPQVAADVFISHSHTDEKDAIALSGFLQKSFGLTTFIDSCVWGYSNDLLKMIAEYSRDNNSGPYNYQKFTRAASHAHMMLSTALSSMIDRTECVFFLNTPTSISPSETILTESTTKSPWIYSEIAMTQLIRKRTPAEHRTQKTATLVEASLGIQHTVSLDHLTKLNDAGLRNWKSDWDIEKLVSRAFDSKVDVPLNVLYSMPDTRTSPR